MPELPTISQYESTAAFYLARLNPRTQLFYYSLLMALFGMMGALPFCKVPITVRVAGILRPASERTEIRSGLSGVIETVYYKEGDAVARNAVLVRLKDAGIAGKKILNGIERTQRIESIQDLQLLVQVQNYSSHVFEQLQTPLYQEQYSHFRYQVAEQEIALQKANQDLEMHTALAKQKVISTKEYTDLQVTQSRMQAAYTTLVRAQLSEWQQALVKNRLELAFYEDEANQLQHLFNQNIIRSPIAGRIQGINTLYAGNVVQAGAILCTVSPEDSLVAECYASAKDIGLIRPNQHVSFQFDAYDHQYFGTGSGRVLAIDDDFTLMQGLPVFKIRCSLNASAVQLKNGYRTRVKKGTGLQARFQVTSRTLWQLLFDHLNDWLDPANNSHL